MTDLAAIERALKFIDDFAADMKAQGIHVGIGSAKPRCASCDEMWPCAASEKQRAIDRLFRGNAG